MSAGPQFLNDPTQDGHGQFAIGIDLGGTKIEGVVLAADGSERGRQRILAPRNDYRASVEAIAAMVERLETSANVRATVGVGIPGSISPRTGLVQNGNSTWLNGKPLDRDLTERLARPVRLANDANCFALSEAVDGAGAGARTVLGVIVGTGVGGGIIRDRQPLDGPRGTGGEWGHNPLPWAKPDEYPGSNCWCGRTGCIETWCAGPAMAADHMRVTGEALNPEGIVIKAQGGDQAAQATLDRHASRLARALAHVVNIVDPDVVVLGGGLSRLQHLYTELPRLMAPWIFSDSPEIDIRPPRWGDAGGVRGAAWLWR